MTSELSSDKRAFGQLVRQRRQAMALSQEALAASALGNADRKSYISALENDRLEKVTPSTAQRLCAALGIAREEIPEPLRWPVAEGGSTIERRVQALEEGAAAVPDRHALVGFINDQLASAVGLSLGDRYYVQLQAGLGRLRMWTGRPFSLQSLFISYALGLLYVMAAALISYGGGSVAVGSVSLFQAAGLSGTIWAALAPAVSLVFVVGTVLACWVMLYRFGRRPLTRNQMALRLGFAALLAGVSCGAAAYLGVDSLAAAALFAVPCFAAVATLRPRDAMLAGAACGVLAGLAAPVSAILQPNDGLDLVLALVEGFVIGSVIGSIAGWASSMTRLSIPHLGSGQLAGAGAGILCGSVLCLVAIMAAGAMGAAETATLGVFAVVWMLLPVANAVLDYISLGISHAIAGLIVRRKPGAVVIVLLALADLCIALALMVLTVTLIGLSLAVLPAVIGVETRGLQFVETSLADIWGQGLWLTMMVLTTCVWTWMHFAGVVAPLAAGLLARRAERAATRRLETARKDEKVAISAGLFVGLRYPVFYGSWAILALLPVIWLLIHPDSIQGLLQLGLQLAQVLLAV